MSDSGPLERVVQDAIAHLSLQPEETRLSILSRSVTIADAMKTTLENEDATLLGRWSALAD